MGRRHIRSVYLIMPKTPRPIASREGQKDALALFSQPRSNDAAHRSLDSALSPGSSREIKPNLQHFNDAGNLPRKVSAAVESSPSAPIKSEIAAEQLIIDTSPHREAAEDAQSHYGANVEIFAAWMMGAESDGFLSHSNSKSAELSLEEPSSERYKKVYTVSTFYTSPIIDELQE